MTNFSDRKKRKEEKKEQKRRDYIDKSNRNKVLLENADFSEMSTQQKIWMGTKIALYAGAPLLIYLCMPAVVIAVGRCLYTGSIKGSLVYDQTSANFYTFIGIICALLYLKRVARKRGSTVREEVSLSFSGLKPKYIMLMLAFGFCVSVSISALYTLLPAIIKSSYDELSTQMFRSYDIALALCTVVVLDPIAEELVFRGYMLNRLLPRLGEKWAILIVTVIFAICHISPLWILYNLIIGWVLAKISIRHDNILYSMAIHIGFNFTVLVNFIITGNAKLNSILFGNKFVILMYLLMFGGLAYIIARKYLEMENIIISYGEGKHEK